MTWYLTGDISPLLSIPPERTVCVDLETTGLDARRDEILQIAIVSGNGSVLMNKLVRPVRHETWKAAQRVSGISPAMVRGCSPFSELADRVRRELEKAQLVVGYNLPFDEKFLRANGVSVRRCLRFDVMREFAPVANQRTGSGEYRWQPLSACARHYGVSCTPHDALEDARATMACFTAMLRPAGCRTQKTTSGEGCPGCRLSYLDVVTKH